MNTRNLILFVFLIISTSVVAQKRAQRPRPVKPVSQGIENAQNSIERGTLVMNNKQQLATFEGQTIFWSMQKDSPAEQYSSVSMADRFHHPGSGAPDFSYVDDLNTEESPYDQNEMRRLGVGDVRVHHPVPDNNN